MGRGGPAGPQVVYGARRGSAGRACWPPRAAGCTRRPTTTRTRCWPGSRRSAAAAAAAAWPAPAFDENVAEAVGLVETCRSPRRLGGQRRGHTAGASGGGGLRRGRGAAAEYIRRVSGYLSHAHLRPDRPHDVRAAVFRRVPTTHLRDSVVASSPRWRRRPHGGSGHVRSTRSPATAWRSSRRRRPRRRPAGAATSKSRVRRRRDRRASHRPGATAGARRRRDGGARAKPTSS